MGGPDRGADRVTDRSGRLQHACRAAEPARPAACRGGRADARCDARHRAADRAHLRHALGGLAAGQPGRRARRRAGHVARHADGGAWAAPGATARAARAPERPVAPLHRGRGASVRRPCLGEPPGCGARTRCDRRDLRSAPRRDAAAPRRPRAPPARPRRPRAPARAGVGGDRRRGRAAADPRGCRRRLLALVPAGSRRAADHGGRRRPGRRDPAPAGGRRAAPDRHRAAGCRSRRLAPRRSASAGSPRS